MTKKYRTSKHYPVITVAEALADGMEGWRLRAIAMSRRIESPRAARELRRVAAAVDKINGSKVGEDHA